MSGTAALRVRIEAPHDHAALIGAVLASLPLSFEPADDGDVVALSGHGDWPDRARAAIAAGAIGVLVTDPVAASVADVRALCDTASAAAVPVRLSCGWADDPAVGALADVLQPEDGSAIFADAHAVVDPDASLLGALTAQLVVLTRTFRSAAHVETVDIVSTGFSAAGHLRRHGQRVPLMLSASRSDAVSPQMRVRLLGHGGRVNLQLFGAGSARPALAHVGDDAGERLLPTIYETGYRAAWRQLRQDIEAGAVDTAALLDRAQHSERAASALDY